MRTLNIRIKYIQGKRNVTADTLLRIIFRDENYVAGPKLEEIGEINIKGEWV